VLSPRSRRLRPCPLGGRTQTHAPRSPNFTLNRNAAAALRSIQLQPPLSGANGGPAAAGGAGRGGAAAPREEGEWEVDVAYEVVPNEAIALVSAAMRGESGSDGGPTRHPSALVAPPPAGGGGGGGPAVGDDGAPARPFGPWLPRPGGTWEFVPAREVDGEGRGEGAGGSDARDAEAEAVAVAAAAARLAIAGLREAAAALPPPQQQPRPLPGHLSPWRPQRVGGSCGGGSGCVLPVQGGRVVAAAAAFGQASGTRTPPPRLPRSRTQLRRSASLQQHRRRRDAAVAAAVHGPMGAAPSPGQPTAIDAPRSPGDGRLPGSLQLCSSPDVAGRSPLPASASPGALQRGASPPGLGASPMGLGASPLGLMESAAAARAQRQRRRQLREKAAPLPPPPAAPGTKSIGFDPDTAGVGGGAAVGSEEGGASAVSEERRRKAATPRAGSAPRANAFGAAAAAPEGPLSDGVGPEAVAADSEGTEAAADMAPCSGPPRVTRLQVPAAFDPPAAAASGAEALPGARPRHAAAWTPLRGGTAAAPAAAAGAVSPSVSELSGLSSPPPPSPALLPTRIPESPEAEGPAPLEADPDLYHVSVHARRAALLQQLAACAAAPNAGTLRPARGGGGGGPPPPAALHASAVSGHADGPEGPAGGVARGVDHWSRAGWAPLAGVRTGAGPAAARPPGAAYAQSAYAASADGGASEAPSAGAWSSATTSLRRLEHGIEWYGKEGAFFSQRRMRRWQRQQETRGRGGGGGGVDARRLLLRLFAPLRE
jgi:hypothetical protein